MSKPLVIFHSNCADGFSSAWVFWRIFKDEYEYYPGTYQGVVPDVLGRDVYLVDFSYKRDIVKGMLLAANSVILIDHHKSALEDLWDLEVDGLNISHSNLFHSSAVLAWKFLNGDKAIPRMLQHIQDRDLWRFELEGTREISTYLFTYEYDFKIWDKLLKSNRRDIDKMISIGAMIDKKHFKDIHELLKSTKRYIDVAGYTVPVASLPYTMSSDAGNIMSEKEPFAACYSDGPNGRIFSLRSNRFNPDAVDVSKIAEQFGGGGHFHASGFTVPRTHPLAMI
jgi:oligoribonuclease NrnB/cAMP/cGMP phosphodiesterase (DHH superfamily)